MKCPYQNSLVPPCKIDAHPQRENVEYCKVCGEWRYLSDIGNDFPSVMWMVVSIAIVVMLMAGLLKQDPMFQPERYRQRRDYVGERSPQLDALALLIENSETEAAS